MINKNAKVYVAGHTGLVGSAIVRELKRQGYNNLVLKTHFELDLTKQEHVNAFFTLEKPEYVFHPAGRVGGIGANSAYIADFMYENMMIGMNVINAAWRSGVKKLLFLGSSCIYPRMAKQPITEDELLSGPLESTNEGYALSKISCLKYCEYLNRQYGTNFISAMPTNLYGPGDNYEPTRSHVLPALIRRFHEAKIAGANEVTCWGDGSPLREFLYVDDLAELCVFLMERYDSPAYLKYCREHNITLSDEHGTNNCADTDKHRGADNGAVNMAADCADTPIKTANISSGKPENGSGCETINAGTGKELTIRELTSLVAKVVGYTGQINWDTSKPNGTPRKLLDVSKATALGWTYKTELEEGIALAYKDFLSRYGNGSAESGVSGVGKDSANSGDQP